MAIENKELATVKRPNTIEYISKETLAERLKEIKRCREDIVYFCENYYRIQSLDKGLHIVKLYDVQKDLLRFMVDQNRAVVCASRQSGKCELGATKLTVRNKKTGKIEVITVEELMKR